MTDQPQTEVTRLGVTAEEFDTFVNLPENADKLFELIGGRIVEVMPTNIRSSQIAGMIITFINMYLLNNPIGYTTTTDGGYMVAGERYIPDVAYISKAKMPKLPVGGGYYHLPPDLAVEVLSPGNTSDEVRRKVAGYLAAGVLTWVFDP
ncbi:MAG: Uma2 family endonuclease, partial [Chloroflexi bacterium]